MLKQIVATQEYHPLNVMLERIRNHHIDIIPIIQQELNNILPQIIEEIAKGVYDNMEAK